MESPFRAMPSSTCSADRPQSDKISDCARRRVLAGQSHSERVVGPHCAASNINAHFRPILLKNSSRYRNRKFSGLFDFAGRQRLWGYHIGPCDTLGACVCVVAHADDGPSRLYWTGEKLPQRRKGVFQHNRPNRSVIDVGFLAPENSLTMQLSCWRKRVHRLDALQHSTNAMLRVGSNTSYGRISRRAIRNETAATHAMNACGQRL